MLYKIFIPGITPYIADVHGLKKLVKDIAQQYPKATTWVIHKDPCGNVKVWECYRNDDGSIAYWGGGKTIRHKILK